ncbi:MAG: LamG domain-containing protein, partial [Anaerolineae bacterium]|nr:LamG domain-containing protein [Anaerolineae bacterium]
MHASKHKPINLYLILIIAGFLLLWLWPTLVAAMPLTAKYQVEQAWQRANQMAGYAYQTRAIQTIHPAAQVENIGRRVETSRIEVEGAIDRLAETMQLDLWPNGKGSPQVISLKIEDGLAYGRLQTEADWTALDTPPTDLFAPGGDPLGFLVAAHNVREISPDDATRQADPLARTFVDANTRRYTFDLNGLQYARFMRSQLEDTLRRQGELPPGLSLDLSRHYVDMVGHGEIWINAAGLPVHQVIHLKFPPDRQALEWVEADITTDFRDWALGADEQGFLLLVRRLWNNPTTLLHNSPFTIHHSQFAPIGLILGFSLLLSGLTLLIVTYRRSPLVYGTLIAAVLLSMLGMPLLQANRALAFSERQQTKAAEYEQQQVEQQAQIDFQAELNGQNFNPTVNPMEKPPSNSPQEGENAIASPPLGGIEGGLPLPASQTLTTTTVFTTGSDSDGDSLTDEVEILELGTDPDNVDTDGDGISDSAEVAGFNLGGTQWYLNPLSMDSNGDGQSDLAGCPNLGDVDENGDLQAPAGSSCTDTDGDGVPNPFDFDNDADGVPNSVDLSPNLIQTLSTTAQDSITFNLSSYQTDTPILAEFQIRPPDEEHLWYSNNYLDWPDQDTEGQIMRVTNDTLSDKGDMLLTPILEIEMPYSAANPTRGLPLTDTVAIGTITATTPFTTWVDQPALDLYGISLIQDEDDGTLHAYVPLVLVEDRVGDMPVAWSGQMLYRLDGGSSGWGQAHNVRLMWLVTALTDTCAAGENDYDTYCAPDSGHWVSETNVVQTYYEDFTLTGLSVKEDYGMEAAIIAQNEAAIADYENYLWVLSHHLQDTFLAAGLVGGSRFDIAEIERRFETGSETERWGIPAAALDVTTLSYPDQISGFGDLLSEQIPTVLANTYPGAAVNRQVSLLVAREESYRSAIWGSGSSVSVSGTAVTVNLSLPEKRTFSSIKWTPYIYDGTGWDNAELSTYLATLETNLGAAIDLSEIVDGAAISDAALTRQGAISFLKSYYLTLYQGLTALTEVDGVPAATEAVVDADFAMNGQSAEKIVLDSTLGLMLAYFENEAAMLLDGQAYADEALTIFTNPANLLEAMGAVDTGTVRLASEQLGGALSEYITKKIYKITKDIHGTKKKYGTYAGKTAGAVTIMGISAAAVLYKAEALNLDDAMVVAYGSFTVAASFDVVAAVGALHKFKTAKYLITELDLLWDIKRLSKFNALSGFILESSLAVGMTLFTGFSQNLFDSEPAAYALIAEAIAQVVVAVVMAVLSLTPVGALVSAVVGLIDAIIGLLCETDVIDAGEEANSWICDGLSGALTKALTYFFNDYTPLVNMEHDDRLDIVINEPTLTQKTEAAGFVEGNQLNLSAVITTSLYTGSPNWMGYLYDSQWDDDNLGRANFVYRLQESETDISVDLDGTSWNIPAGRSPVPAVGIANGKRFYKDFQASHTYTLGSPGVNQGIHVYLSEGFNVMAQNCWFAFGPNCWLEEYDDTSHIDMSESLVFDIFPNTIAGFRELTAVGNDSYRLAWHDDFYSVQVDADNDGLRSKESGGPDPNDSLPDSDFDGLGDLFEYQHGSSLTEADADCDGLTDYWETFYNTNPNQPDSDNDGLIDGEEMFHPNRIYPYKNSAATNANPTPCSGGVTSYTGGWSIVYDYSAAGQPLSTWVSADPNEADLDGDNINDSREKVYGYNPNVARTTNILSLSSAIESDSGATPYVAPGGQIDYTAVISNGLDNRYAFGLLQAEFPVDTVLKTQVIDTLAPLESITMTGSIAIGSGYSSDSYSMTIRSGAIIDPGTGRRLWLRFNESAGSTVFADSSLNDNNATCSVCPTANEQYAAFNRSVTNQRLSVDTANGNFKTTAFSLGGWLYPTDLNSSDLLQETGLYDVSIVGAGAYAYPRARIYLNGHTLEVTGDASQDVEQNAFNHVMLTFYFDEATTTATLKLYLNGELIDTDTYSAALLGTSSTMVIGDSFSGYLDDIEYYNRALSDAEIDALVNQPVLDIDFGTLSDLSSTQAALSCSGDSCPARDDQWASFDQLDYVSVSDPALNLSGGQFSFATWLKPQPRNIPFDPAARSAFSQYLVDTSRDWQGVFGANQTSDSNHYPTLYVSDAGQLWMGFRTNNTDCTYKTATNTVSVNGWNHLTVTYNGSRWFVYVNGVLKGSSGPCAIAPPSLSAFTIGRPNAQNYFYLDN